MTRAAVAALIGRAKALVAGGGSCQEAQATLAQAWEALGQYSATLAARGASTVTAISLHHQINKVQTQVSRYWRTHDPDALAPMYQPGARRGGGGTDPDSLAPMHGVGDEMFSALTTTLVTLGVLASAGGLGYGLYVMYKGGE